MVALIPRPVFRAWAPVSTVSVAHATTALLANSLSRGSARASAYDWEDVPLFENFSTAHLRLSWPFHFLDLFWSSLAINVSISLLSSAAHILPPQTSRLASAPSSSSSAQSAVLNVRKELHSCNIVEKVDTESNPASGCPLMCLASNCTLRFPSLAVITSFTLPRDLLALHVLSQRRCGFQAIHQASGVNGDNLTVSGAEPKVALS